MCTALPRFGSDPVFFVQLDAIDPQRQQLAALASPPGELRPGLHLGGGFSISLKMLPTGGGEGTLLARPGEEINSCGT